MKSTQSLIALAVGIAALASLPSQVVKANAGTHAPLASVETKATRDDTTSAPTAALRRGEVVRGALVYANTRNQLREALWALNRYSAEGLELPRVTIRMHTTTEACGGHSGVRRVEHDLDVIDICTTARWTMLHELAHVWAGHNLSEEDRKAFVALQNLEGWSGSETPWGDRGTEQAADLIAWSLADSDHIPRHLWRGSIAQLNAAYETLTSAGAEA